ncbi:MAG: rod shape-determining protein MreD [Acidimicrobiaceae bacterium]|nr:rod shape-determining protein MreD [Acidimicrobiaceae bacterium]MXW62137.1 rod shape-determining protein MreD [Acidimicrobiaceae bacterium]MXW75709.1 rod shape-determining protein MreD [Acidimicrobiaceae bacterium]MYA75505.1 rod shape-determining protein MreD [Acidimicrobiaceae bacterium]MYC42877.1 rod shape-determining protein MreD [Acidimicrobiaceae bacterium]
MSALRLGVLILLTLVVQVTVFADVRIWGIAPELLVLFAVMLGYWAGPQSGPTAAFVIGLLWDVYLPTPLGLSAIVFAMVAFAVGTGGAELFRDSKVQLAAIAAVGTFGAVTGYALLGEVMGQRGLVDLEMLRVALIAGLINALLAPLTRPLVAWALGPTFGLSGAGDIR